MEAQGKVAQGLVLSQDQEKSTWLQAKFPSEACMEGEEEGEGT